MGITAGIRTMTNFDSCRLINPTASARRVWKECRDFVNFLRAVFNGGSDYVKYLVLDVGFTM